MTDGKGYRVLRMSKRKTPMSGGTEHQLSEGRTSKPKRPSVQPEYDLNQADRTGDWTRREIKTARWSIQEFGVFSEGSRHMKRIIKRDNICPALRRPTHMKHLEKFRHGGPPCSLSRWTRRRSCAIAHDRSGRIPVD